jgi:two-component system cell cycle response regulator
LIFLDKYKRLVEERIINSFKEWADSDSVEEKEIYRFLHNLKGTAGTIGMAETEKKADQLLDLFSQTSVRTFTYSECNELLKSLLVHMPVDPPEDNAAKQLAVESHRFRDRILIIDDDVHLAAYLKGMLEDRGYPVNIALSADGGLKLFYDWKPELILLDILLPDTNGLEVLKQIVEKSRVEHIPIIVISSEDTKENRIHAYQAGAMDFFAKPIDQELLIALINNRFQMKRHWEHSIIIDELTGAYNRKHFNLVMKNLIKDFQQYNHRFTLALMDLDHFKRVNDTYGHLMGDEVLRKFVAIIKENISDEDSLCRYGGEEFALIVPNRSPAQVVKLLEQIRVQFSTHEFEFKKPLQVTFTAGITEIHSHNTHPEELIVEADQALYCGKHSGRNQTIVFSPRMGIDSGYKLNMLVVDDDPLIREMIVTQFERWKPSRNLQLTIREYKDGIEFLASDWYEHQNKYIVLLDGAMPNLDGVEVLNKLRHEYPERNIVVAMLTARINQTDIIHALQQGADDYIVKPFHMADLVSRVERLVDKLFK